jgi:hypothetical protein
MAHPLWRPASAAELTALVLDPTRPTAREELQACVCLFVVPMHLRSAFWDLLAGAQERGAISSDEFSTFAAEVARFLAFKELPVPAGAEFDLVLNRPGQRASLAVSSLCGLINLGEDAASVVFLGVPANEGEASDHTAVRFRIQPGEGARIPAGVLLTSDHIEREQPDVLLLIRRPLRVPPVVEMRAI